MIIPKQKNKMAITIGFEMSIDFNKLNVQENNENKMKKTRIGRVELM